MKTRAGQLCWRITEMTRRPYIKPPAWHDCIWHSGPPPSVGWWPASKRGDPTVLRWWNGSNWSLPVPDRTHSRKAASYARKAEPLWVDFEVVWTDRWWETRK